MSSARPSFFITKMQGAGNSFLLTTEIVPLAEKAKIAKELCSLNFGIGAEGMVFLKSEKSEIIEWDFYNSDGSMAEFCGNAARCVAIYIFDKNPDVLKIEIKTQAGSVHCAVKDSKTVEVEMPKVEWKSKALVTPFWPQPVVWINTGVPHIVIEVAAFEDLKKFKKEAAQIRAWSQLGAMGSNVTFVFMHSSEKASAVTFERGVEDFTLACGTGAVAAAWFIMEKNKTNQCLVKMPGGDLHVSLVNGKTLMRGEAYKIADLTLSSELLNKGSV